MFATFWSVVTWPFRAIAWTVDFCGRFAAGLVGFALMVAGTAVLAGAYYLVGGLLFLGGLVLVLRTR